MGFHLRLSARPEDFRLMRAELRRLLRGVGVREEVISQVLTACCEAAANAICHPIQPSRPGFEVKARANPDQVFVMVRDFGRWRVQRGGGRGEDGGMGFTLMQSLMDDVRLRRTRRGSFVRMQRTLRDERFATEVSG